jgi:hypothetical protein
VPRSNRHTRLPLAASGQRSQVGADTAADPRRLASIPCDIAINDSYRLTQIRAVGRPLAGDLVQIVVRLEGLKQFWSC